MEKQFLINSLVQKNSVDFVNNYLQSPEKFHPHTPYENLNKQLDGIIDTEKVVKNYRKICELWNLSLSSRDFVFYILKTYVQQSEDFTVYLNELPEGKENVRECFLKQKVCGLTELNKFDMILSYSDNLDLNTININDERFKDFSVGAKTRNLIVRIEKSNKCLSKEGLYALILFMDSNKLRRLFIPNLNKSKRKRFINNKYNGYKKIYGTDKNLNQNTKDKKIQNKEVQPTKDVNRYEYTKTKTYYHKVYSNSPNNKNNTKNVWKRKNRSITLGDLKKYSDKNNSNQDNSNQNNIDKNETGTNK